MQTEWNFDAVNSAQEIILKPGKYKLECWGARGGAKGTPFESGFYYGYGGYCSGEITLKKETTLYLYVGIDDRKGYNFNGAGYGNGASGGGATDIRLIGGTWDNEQGLLSRIIVAGGGGGTYDKQHGGDGGGLKGTLGTSSTGAAAHGGTQFEGGRGRDKDGSCDGFFGKGATPENPSSQSGGGGGWFGGAYPASGFGNGSGGGSGYVLTKDSYKPPGYTPTSEYYFDNVVMTTGGNTTVVGNYSDGRAKITLLQALPFLTVSSYNSTQATFKADHTDPTLLTKIEYFIDDILKETITTDLTLEKTINYTLEDNALHTLKIVVTDSANATAEKVVSISKGIAPLPAGSTTDEVTNKWIEIKDTFKSGKTSIINTLALKNIEASLNNTLVELSEKIKTSFDSSDASAQDLMNQLTQANNTISQLNSKYKYASGTIDVVKNSSLMANLYGESFGRQPGTWLKIDNLGFIPNIFVAECQYVTSNNYFFKHIVIATCNINWLWEKKDFSARIVFTKEKNSNQDFSGSGIIYSNNERDVYINNKGINVPASSPNVSSYLHSWHAIKFI
ncbi:glycine rich domain-containing protein [Clostridioides difficile]|uniref:glycine rich domain-containing protein n=1 Tax=Clostridioides difficile TaxID=1496 RepID=UPI0029C4104A|nr:glycine rich domain-containing protein [Clostridioides difficile]MDX5763579.1 glycine rich domain-containing protein [Clostridioides difficile]